MKKIISLLIISVVLFSCDTHEPPTFQGEQTFVYFDRTSANLDIVVDDVGTLEVQINTTTLSTADRSVQFEIVTEDLDGDGNPDSNALEENYDIPSFNVTIPAGEYFGSFVINGVDVSAETDRRLLILRLVDAGSDALISDALLEIGVRQICPVPEGFFTGPYLLEQITPDHPANGGPTFEGTVDLVENGGSTERSFDADWIGFGNLQTYPIDFSCNNVIVTDIIDTNLVCVQGNPSITLGPASETGNYDSTDDSSFTFVIAEYLDNGGCSVPSPLITEFNLIKQ